MNTIPSIFNEKKVPHTVVGGTTKKSDESESPFTVLLLNRGGRYYRASVFRNLEAAGFDSVVSIETASEPYDIENLSIRFPKVKFLVPLEKISIGEMINTGMAETTSPYVFVIWNDIKVSPSIFSNRLKARITDEPVLCTTPMMTNAKLESLPVQMVPAINRREFQVEPMACYRDGSPTVYPFDFIGIYHREKFIQVGGFDYTITNPYWQNLDFGFRSYLWGERITVASGFRLSYEGEIPGEDITPDDSYMRFYLKNLTPVFKNDEAYVPFSRLFSYLGKSGSNIFDAWAQYAHVRKWVRLNKYRFMQDATILTENWEPCIQ